MTEKSFPWDGLATGDCGPYSAAEWSNIWKYMFINDDADEGVFTDIDPFGSFDWTQGANYVAIAAGAAIVDGRFYYADSSPLTVYPTAPGSGYNYYTVVLHSDTTAQTVRIALLGPSAVTYPTPTAVPPVKEIVLYHIRIADNGTILTTDLRKFIFKRTVQARNGGSSTDWSLRGVTSYYPEGDAAQSPLMQCGSSIFPNAYTSVIVPFPRAFSSTPLVVVSALKSDGTNLKPLTIVSINSTEFVVEHYDGTAAPVEFSVMWVAYGPQ